MKWRAILETNQTVEADTEEEAKRKVLARLTPDDIIVWEDWT